ncbi:MAG: hypothetical protein AUJ85_00755 [Elusimicrobia bacterium CG1_02_37_114]|nr:MAG: hypothetical protein AUJ85_00755 [Elusimicrobia bacterium CG1_02_37_114]PIV53010.1 MAG: RNA polymerase subunit sigma [Elusimicrobia bacterium CG02_land_8_20_14_3_00_37_13]PIZ14302.1 MAG: RNA polymerase subunit sigma [Elusimicrobia bacterium CG_4_10_14_0_8_um_filter_37_32]
MRIRGIADTYLSRVDKIPKLSKQEFKKLFLKAKKGNSKATKKIIESNLHLVLPLAKKYCRPGIDLLDLVEEGNLGLMRAIKKYKPGKKVLLSTYATYWIEQSIRRAIEEQSKTIRIPSHIWESLKKWIKNWEHLHGELGRSPTLAEMAQELNFSVKQLKNITDTIEISHGIGSLETPIDEDGELFVKDVLKDSSTDTPENLIASLRTYDEMDKALGQLPPRERRILELRFGLKDNKILTLEQLGKKFHLSRERIRQLEKRAQKRLQWIAYKMRFI